ncbi:MAG: hypothetical protein FJ290_26630, partial [Planctomycetes bacterium]|nr:hypothetical protein [Planctomycetota bacterium]
MGVSGQGEDSSVEEVAPAGTAGHELNKVSVRAPARRVVWMLIGVSVAALAYGLYKGCSHLLTQALSCPDPAFGISNDTGRWLQDVKVTVSYAAYVDEKWDAPIIHTVQKGVSPMPPSGKLYVEVPVSDLTLDSVSFHLPLRGSLWVAPRGCGCRSARAAGDPAPAQV